MLFVEVTSLFGCYWWQNPLSQVINWNELSKDDGYHNLDVTLHRKLLDRRRSIRQVMDEFDLYEILWVVRDLSFETMPVPVTYRFAYKE